MLWLAAVLLALIGLGNVPLRDWDESLVARVALELSRSPGFAELLPTYLGSLYLNKPPGLHLAIAGAIRLWQWSSGNPAGSVPPEWVVRLVPAVVSSLLVPLLGLVQFRLRPDRRDAAIATALISLTLLPLARHGRLAMLDGSQLSAMALVWWGVLQAATPSWRALLAGLLAGLGGSMLLLLKAPVVAPVLAGTLLLRAMDRELDRRSWRWLLTGLGLAILPGLAWHAWHLAARGDAALVMWGPQGLGRLLHEVNGNGGGALLPLIQVLVGGWPWLPLLPAGIRLAWRQRHGHAGRWTLGLGLMAVLMVLPLRTQLPWYSLLLWPPFALMCGPVLADLARGRPAAAGGLSIRPLGLLWRGLGALLLGAAGLGLLLPARLWSVEALLTALPAGVGLLLAGQGLVRVSRDGETPALTRGPIMLLAVGWLASLALLFTGPLWNWELAEQPAIGPALALVVPRQGSDDLHLLAGDGASQRPSLLWYLDVSSAPLQRQAHHWPHQRFQLLTQALPEWDDASGRRCHLERSAAGGWQRWRCDPVVAARPRETDDGS